MIKHHICKEDRELFSKMATSYISVEEKVFFEKLNYKQEWELTVSHELILDEAKNDDGIYIVRCEYEEYIVGQKDTITEQHVMCLADALNINLKEAKLCEKDTTLLLWLRDRNYDGVEYNHNYDKI